ncbi:DUF4129 domain-containing protein [Paenibacillus thermotolerans]|uniref:DUF4129 domain-containing protein n=1 Tax=Paenibacillus thermotolerans TaxID=3027807 RepID=UPI0023685E4C|nr:MULTISPECIES: DUF4129 domain-containing protein [unclassified Paenibacillus]
MSEHRSSVWKHAGALWLASAVELLMLLPAWLLVDAYSAPPQAARLWMLGLPAVSLAGVLLTAWLPIEAVWKRIVTAAPVAALFALLTAYGAEWLYCIPMFVAGFTAATLSFTVYHRMWESKLYWFGLGFYFVASIVFGLMPQLRPDVPLLTAAGCLSAAITVFASNGAVLRQATLATGRRQAVPAQLRTHNRTVVLGLLLLSAALTAGLGDTIGRFVLGVIKALLGLLLRDKQPELPPPPPEEKPAPMPQLPQTDAGPSLLMKILDMVFYIIGYALLAGLAAVLLYWLYKNGGGIVRRWMRALLAWLRRSAPAEQGEEYTDEESDVLTWESAKRSLSGGLRMLERIASALRPERWETMNGRERVRFLYRRWLRPLAGRGYEAKRHLTPAETVRDAASWAERAGVRIQGDDRRLIELYNKARYSNADITKDEAEELRRSMNGT